MERYDSYSLMASDEWLSRVRGWQVWLDVHVTTIVGFVGGLLAVWITRAACKDDCLSRNAMRFHLV